MGVGWVVKWWIFECTVIVFWGFLGVDQTIPYNVQLCSWADVNKFHSSSLLRMGLVVPVLTFQSSKNSDFRELTVMWCARMSQSSVIYNNWCPVNEKFMQVGFAVWFSTAGPQETCNSLILRIVYGRLLTQTPRSTPYRSQGCRRKHHQAANYIDTWFNRHNMFTACQR